MTEPAPAFSWRTTTIAIYGPATLFAIGEGAVLPMLPRVAGDLGAGLALAGFIAAMSVVGELLGSMSSARILPRFGERRSMVAAGLAAIIGSTIAGFASAAWVLALGVLLIGTAAGVFGIARHAFMTTYVPIATRARALSTLGGVFRLGLMIGPLLIAGLVALGGSEILAFAIQAFCAMLAVILVLVVPDPESSFGALRGRRSERPALGFWRTVRSNARTLATVGVGAAIMSALRQSRLVILPLWAVAIGIDSPTAALIIGIAMGLDVALFYAGGWIMDRFGRFWVVVPSTAALGLGHLLLVATADIGAEVAWFTIGALALGLANGIGSGVLMTLGADLADQDQPAPFLAVWRVESSLGGAAAPLLLAGITAIGSLAIAAAAIGGIGLLGAAVFWASMPRRGTARPAAVRSP